ncbi:hypothetical protein NHF40_13440 [Maricaulaceae bacterium EIL42A08]|nr:hypothetical protein [Maricaulaceae bacterium EIL42A08]
MQLVSIDDANPGSGEETYILQLSMPSARGADGGALMDKIGQFVELFLASAEPSDARFAKMGGNTWVIAASAESAFTLDQARAGLATSLYGEDDGTQVQLEWPFGVEPVDPNSVENKIDSEPTAEGDLEADPDAVIAELETLVSQSASDADDSAGADNDDWTLAESPSESLVFEEAEAEGGSADEMIGDDLSSGDAFFQSDDLDIDAVAAASSEELAPATSATFADEVIASDSADPERADEDDVFVLDDLNFGSANEISETVLPTTNLSDPTESVTGENTLQPAEDDASNASWDLATAAERAAFDDESDVFEVDAYDVDFVDDDEVPPDATRPTPASEIEEPPVFVSAPDEPVWGEPQTTKAEPDMDSLEALTEVPERPRAPDIAGEISAFRAEMRQIAAGIPGGAQSEVLSDFRAELDAITGAMGQRVDGAAQRIEAAASEVVDAASRLDADRLSDAADRAERSAATLEASVEEALKALNIAVKSMSADSADPAADAAS